MQDELTKVLTDSEAMHKMASIWSNQDFYPLDDLVQDTILQCLTNKDKLRTTDSVTGWVYRVMKNLFINCYRRSSRMQFVSLIDCTSTGSYTMPDTDILEKIIADGKYDLLVQKALGYKYDELAEKMGITVGTVKSRIFHQRRQVIENYK